MAITARLSSSVVGDGDVPPLEVGASYVLDLAVHRPPADLGSDAWCRLGWDRWEVDVTGRVAVVQQHAFGGAAVLVGADRAAFVVHLDPGAEPVTVGQPLTVTATPAIDPWAWFCGPDFPPSEDFARRWRVVRVQQVTSPLVPMPGFPGTSVADHARAVVEEVAAVVRWPDEGLHQSVSHLVDLEPDDDDHASSTGG